MTSSSEHMHAQPLREGGDRCLHHQDQVELGAASVTPQTDAEAQELAQQAAAEREAMYGPEVA